ncbi:RDD family protein [Pseudoxanthomonas sp. UTMC 1351]|uniref:RDD family protein n=1 Tax=Pseudoxanthomonas sp. UTMC 1351 TaxID=2695853 RepID=UPI0034CD0AB6
MNATHHSTKKTHASGPGPGKTLIGWRLLALVYDVWPVLALWMLISAAFTFGYYLTGHSARQNIAPLSPLQILLWLLCWGVTGLYAVLSWRRGGQTLGMRPWRLKVVATDGGPASWRALGLRFVVATLSTLAGGLGFWWAWVDREKLTLHDRFSGTRMIRLPK